jgi:translation initiation factor 1
VKPKTVYSTETKGRCPKCGWPQKQCRCSTTFDQPVPDRVVARLRIEKAGRKGKTVTVVEGLPRNQPFLKGLAKELKKACGSGGTVVEDRVEIQGDHREKLRVILAAKKWSVKG